MGRHFGGKIWETIEIIFSYPQDICWIARGKGIEFLKAGLILEVLAHRGWLVREDTRVIVNIISKKIKLPRTTFHYSAYKHLRHNISCELGLSCSARILVAILMRSRKGKT